jgi:methylmalonyl-CoA/ethylmalonyl-CoA epimerase
LFATFEGRGRVFLRIDHIGVATSDLSGAAELLAGLGLVSTAEFSSEAYGVDAQMWDVGGGGALELVAPAREDSAVSGLLRRCGPGPYHVAVEVDDLAAEIERLWAAGATKIDRRPRPGHAPGVSVQYVHLPKPVNLFLELVEYGPEFERLGVTRP